MLVTKIRWPPLTCIEFVLLSIHSYISKVDVLKILVSANYKYIPSLDDIQETAAVTRLRNQLLEAEYYQLAVEVSVDSFVKSFIGIRLICPKQLLDFEFCYHVLRCLLRVDWTRVESGRRGVWHL